MSSSPDSSDTPSSQSPTPTPHTPAQQLWTAIRLIKWEDITQLPSFPCARNSLLMGIGSGVGVFALRSFAVSPWVAGNWGVGAFMFISAFSWESCQSKYRKDREATRTILEKYPERYIKTAQQRAEERRAADSGTAGRAGSTEGTSSS